MVKGVVLVGFGLSMAYEGSSTLTAIHHTVMHICCGLFQKSVAKIIVHCTFYANIH